MFDVVLTLLSLSFFFVILPALVLAAFAFWIYTLVHVLGSDMENDEKLIWVVVIVFTQIVGSIIYYFMKLRTTDT
jgi:hypothetical protein